jgi:hypothetical protein
MSNYDIDVDTPKPEHTAFLDAQVVSILKAGPSRIWLQGSASRTGTAAHNMDLSRRRAENVANYLRSVGVADAQMNVDAVGAGLASTTLPENADDRAVSLLAAPLFTPPPPPPVPPVPTMPTATSFRIKAIGSLSAGEGLSAEVAFFHIWDPAHSISSIYGYSALSGGGSAMPVSVTLEGPWNDFMTSGLVAVNEFGGAARFTTGGAAWFTINYLNMMSMPRGTKTYPNPLRISTGFTVGLSVSTSIGSMTLQSSGPFTGP